ncbi:hypothetical protein ACFQY7_46900 [Actinomadura luteofluorescens]|uniref:hypothetical protein n=1 Tax=Actinomadura luteofluorescens TaxID=46163 RepID=UPI00362B44AF
MSGFGQYSAPIFIETYVSKRLLAPRRNPGRWMVATPPSGVSLPKASTLRIAWQCAAITNKRKVTKVNLGRIRRNKSPERLYRRLGHFYGWVVRHPRRAARWLAGHPRRAKAWIVTTVVGSLWLLAATSAHIAGAIFQRTTTAVMQPLTADHQLVAVQATTVTYLFSAPLYWVLLTAGRRRLQENRLLDAVPHTERRDRILSGLSHALRRCPRRTGSSLGSLRRRRSTGGC